MRATPRRGRCGRSEEAGRTRPTLAAVVGVVVLVLTAGLGITQGGDQVRPATIMRLRGDVFLRAAADQPWRRANERERIQPGWGVKTGDGAEAILELSDRNLVRVGPKSEFNLDVALVRRETVPGATVAFFPARRDVHQFEVELPQGNAASVLRGLNGQSRYNLRTPVATAGVRGTIFVSTVAPPAAPGLPFDANFLCLEGALEMTGEGLAGPMTIPAGFSLHLQGGGGGNDDGGGGPGGGPGGGGGHDGEGGGHDGEGGGSDGEGGGSDGEGGGNDGEGGGNDNAHGGNVGEGNQGEGVGNTGPGNQGEGPNAEFAGNAGGGLVGGEGALPTAIDPAALAAIQQTTAPVTAIIEAITPNEAVANGIIVNITIQSVGTPTGGSGGSTSSSPFLCCN